MNASYKPADDGVTHINIYADGLTRLGVLLSHFAHTPFIHPYFGPFASMEGFWYYLKAEKKDERLRQLYGPEAKFYGKKLPSIFVKYFEELIVDANFHKVIQNNEITTLMLQSNLPFEHYYLTNKNGFEKQVKIEGFEWLVDGFEEIRRHLKTGSPHKELDYEMMLRS